VVEEVPQERHELELLRRSLQGRARLLNRFLGFALIEEHPAMHPVNAWRRRVQITGMSKRLLREVIESHVVIAVAEVIPNLHIIGRQGSCLSERADSF